MKKFLLLSIAFLFVFTLTQTTAQKKNVLLEQFTGAWCGWCVDGTVVMDELIKDYPDQVIGVKIHNGDSMAVSLESVIRGPLGVSGFPSGTVNRKFYNGSISQSRTNWRAVCETAMNEKPQAEVQMAYSINEETNQLYATVYCTMLETVNKTLRFNVYIIEDSVSGTGTGWDQSNYLSGRDGYQDNPYYDQPSKIVGYQHMKVMRDMCGGAWGSGSMPNPAVQGEVYTFDFVYDLNPEWNKDQLHFVGLVQVDETSDKEILNSCMGVEGEPELQLTSTGKAVDVVPMSTPFGKTYNLKNLNGVESTFSIMAKLSDRTPANWMGKVVYGDETITADSENDATMEITLSPGEEITFDLQIIPGSDLGIGDVELEVSSLANPDLFKGRGEVTCYSQEIKNFEIVNPGEAIYSVKDDLFESGYNDFVMLSPDKYHQFKDKFPVLDHLVWNTGSADRLTETDVNTILAAINDGHKVFVCGNLSASYMNNYGALTAFGVEYNGFSRLGYGSAPWRVWLSGMNGDPISQDFGQKTEGNLIKYLITLLKITDNEKAKPFLHLTDRGTKIIPSEQDTVEIDGKDAYFAVRCYHENTRSVLMALCPNVIVNDQARAGLIDKIMQWLNNTGPELDLSRDIIDFEDVIVDETRKIPLVMHNPGDEDLEISEISIGGMDSYAFAFDNTPELPMTLSPGEYKNVIVTFEPIAPQEYKAELTLKSDAGMNSDIKLDIIGEAITTGVTDQAGLNGIFTVSPNPAAEKVIINIDNKLSGISPEAGVYNAGGSMVMKINNLQPGENEIDLRNLSSGVYYINVEIGSKRYFEMLVINR